jgi:trimethylamine--corrinoid protein Co-methyltransferase
MIAEYRDQGPYLESEHTMEHYRERWYPNLFERTDYETWAANGELSLVERAVDRVDQILEDHEPKALPEAVLERLEEIVNRAQTEGA